MILSLVLILSAFVVHGIAKGYADAIWFGWQYLKFAPQWMIDWILRDPNGEHNGNPLKCDAWHFCDGHVMQWCICLGVIGGAFFGVSLWLIPLVWLGYYLEGRVFTLVFHCYLMQDWEFKFWLRDTFTF
jgi:hypothetical protein